MPAINNRNKFEFLKQVDYFAIFLQILLLSGGVLFIYVTGLEIGGEFAKKWYKQVFWILLGIGVYCAAASIDYRILGKFSVVFYIFSLLLLISLFFFGLTINGSRSWLSVPGLGFFQPSELAKPFTLFFAAWAGSRPSFRNSIWLNILFISATVFIPTLLVCLQPDMGTALIFFPFTFALILLCGIRWHIIFAAAFLLLVTTPLIYSKMAAHQHERIKVFLEPPAQALMLASAPFLTQKMEAYFQAKLDDFFAVKKGQVRDTWNAQQSLLAVGSGGLSGKGLLKGTQHVLGYLPKTVAPTDFIFSVIAEETGFLGSFSLLIMLCCLVLCFCRTALLARNDFGSYLAVGAAVIIATHVIINIGMTVQAVPIIGVPLPYVSYGGSFMLGIMLLSGLVQNVHIHRRITSDEDEED